jgi:hypothetical protein
MTNWLSTHKITALVAALALLAIIPVGAAHPQQVTVTPKLAYSPVCTSTSCAADPAGFVSIAVGSASVTVTTSAVTANSQILAQMDTSLASALGVTTCNNATKLYYVSARTPGTSFTISTATALATNPACLSYVIIN